MRWTALIGLGLLAGCFATGPDCINENRNVTREGTLATGERAYLALDEERDAGSDRVNYRRLEWAVYGNLGADVATAVHIHQGAVGSDGPIVATLPILDVQGGVVVTRGFVLEPSFLADSYDEFYAKVRTQPLYVEVHTTQFPAGRFRIPITVTFDNPWVHPYCS